ASSDAPPLRNSAPLHRRRVGLWQPPARNAAEHGPPGPADLALPGSQMERKDTAMQNLLSLTLSEQDLADLDGALETLRRVFAPLIALQPAQRRDLYKMGSKSETFCRQTLALLAANPQMVPPNLGLAEAQADLVALDALRPRLIQLRQLLERGDDTEMALGSDIIGVALEGYALLKVSGKGEALKGARRELSARFAKGTRAPEPVAALAE